MVSLNKGQRERGGNRKRREFCAITISGLAGATFLSSIASEAPGGTEKTYKTTDSGIKLAVSHIFYPDLTDEMLGFMNQLGLDGIEGWVSGEYATYEHIVRFREQVEKAGLTLFEVGLLDTYNSDEELWDNYIYFMKRILPVAEDSGVRLALHPNDPPVPVVNGIPQIFRSNGSFERAMEIANHSPYSGICFCVGTWGEMAGPDGKGEDILGAIRHFGKTGNIFTVHY